VKSATTFALINEQLTRRKTLSQQFLQNDTNISVEAKIKLSECTNYLAGVSSSDWAEQARLGTENYDSL